MQHVILYMNPAAVYNYEKRGRADLIGRNMNILKFELYKCNKYMFAGHLRIPVLGEVFSSLVLLCPQLSANGPENIFVTFVQRTVTKTEFRKHLIRMIQRGSINEYI